MVVLRLRGVVWGGTSISSRPGEVDVGSDGTIAAVRPALNAPDGAAPPVIEGAWVGPALVDAHVHLAFGDPESMLRGGVGAVRDLGAPLDRAVSWKSGRWPIVAAAGEILTAPGGYPMAGWGSDGFGFAVADPDEARTAVARLAAAGVDVVKLALEPNAGPVPGPDTCHAVVASAHAAGLAVTCHALTASMVERALDAGVDELCHTPTEELSAPLVDRLADRGVRVVSTLHTFVASGGLSARGATTNARALVAAGVAVVYGTDLGNGGTRPGASVEELDLLSEAGLGREGALIAATEGAATVAGLVGRVDVSLRAGARTVLVVLDDDPVRDPRTWARPIAVVASGRVVGGTAAHAGDAP